ncbi:MAG: hypothetical protein KDC54_04055 [Lewinella sp.]|nr:hypothetical protein [Lewinella sp.]
MKSNWLLLLSLPAFLFLSCNHVAQFHEPIESLAKQWENVSPELQALKEQIAADLDQATSLQEQITATKPEDIPANRKSIAETLRSDAEQLVAQLSALQEEITTDFTECDEQLTMLKQGLAEGQLPGDVEETTALLYRKIAAVQGRLVYWKGTMSSHEGTIRQLTESLRALTAAPAATN